MKTLAAILIAVGGVATIGGAAFAADAGLTPVDRDFINKAAQGHQMEIAAGKLAAQRAMDTNVKQFGERIVSDHTAALEALKTLAASKQMPQPDNSLSPEGNTAVGKLESLSGSEFDKQYSKMMVKDHTADITAFQTEAKKGVDADVKAYAEQTLPALRHHLMMANQLAGASNR